MATEPTMFDWWSGIIIPASTGLLSLILAGVSLGVAIAAWRIADKSRIESLTLTRRERAKQLSVSAEAISSLIWQGAFDDSWSAARALNREFWLSGDVAARSISNQLAYWAMFAMQHRPTRALREAIASDIVFSVNEAIGAYAEGVSDDWKIDRHTVDDLPDLDLRDAEDG
jgi:hypothetical protein